MGARFVGKTFANFKQALQSRAFKVMSTWDGETSIVLSSPDKYGLGKTHLAAALVNKLLATETAVMLTTAGRYLRCSCPVYFTGEVDLLARIRATFNHQEDGETEAEVYRQLSTVDLLIIDDVGKLQPRDPAFLQGVYYRLIDNRYRSEQPIILLTNLSLAELERHIGGACADRLREMAGKHFVLMQGMSYRLPVRKETHDAPTLSE